MTINIVSIRTKNSITCLWWGYQRVALCWVAGWKSECKMDERTRELYRHLWCWEGESEYVVNKNVCGLFKRSVVNVYHILLTRRRKSLVPKVGGSDNVVVNEHLFKGENCLITLDRLTKWKKNCTKCNAIFI